MTQKQNELRIGKLENKMKRIEYILWYVAGALSIDLLGPNVMPLFAIIG